MTNKAEIVVSGRDTSAPAIEKAKANLAALKAEAATVNTALTALGGITTLVFAGTALRDYVKNAVDGIDALNDLKDASGASIENISALEDIAARTGTTFESVSSTLVKFNKVLSEAKPDSAIGEIFKQLNLDVDQLKRLDPAEALRLTAVELARYADDGNKARIFQELFGKSVRETAPFLNDLAAAAKLTATVTTEQAREAEKFNQELFRMRKNSEDTARALVGPLIAAFNATIEKLREGTKESKGFLDTLLAINKTFAREQFKLLGIDLEDSTQQRAERIATLTKLLEGENLTVERRARLQNQLNHLIAKQPKLDSTAGAGRGSVNPDLVKPSLGEIGKPDKASTASTRADPSITEFNALLDRLAQRAAADREQLAVGRQLTDSERLALDVESQLAGLRTKLTDSQKESVRARLAEVQTLDAQVVGMLRLSKLQEEEVARVEQNLQALQSESIAIAEANTALQDGLRTIGLNVREREQLTIARLKDTLSVEQGTLAEQRALGVDQALIIAQQEKVRLLERQIELRQQTATALNKEEDDPLAGALRGIKAFQEETRKAGVATEHLVGDTIRSFEDALTDGLSGKKVDFKSLIDSFIAETTRLYVVRPLLDSLFGKDGGNVKDLLGGLANVGKSGDSGGGLFDLLSKGFGAFKGLLGFAGGGDLDPFKPVMVGERGRELFVPQIAGRIVPNSQLANLAAQPAPAPRVQHITINVPQGTSRQSAEQLAADIAMRLNRASARNN